MIDIVDNKENIYWESKEVKEFEKYLKIKRVKPQHKTLTMVTPHFVSTIDDPKCKCKLCKTNN